MKSAPLATLVDAIRRVGAGGLAFDRRPGEDVSLTPRERSVLTLLLDGRTNDEIGQALGITTRSVEAHLSRLFERGGAASTASTRQSYSLRVSAPGWRSISEDSGIGSCCIEDDG